MRIDIWSDVVCPFCLIGKRHLELALEQFEHRDDVEIIWHSFELDPNAPQVSEELLVDSIAKKYGISREQSMASQQDIAARAAAVGIIFDWENAKPGNAFNAHRLIHLAETHGLVDEAEERFKQAYFGEGQSIGETAVLRQLALDIGLPAPEIDEVLSSDKFAAEVRADEQAARELGINGVPYFLLENKWVINGAQPVELMLNGLRTVWNEIHQPKVTNLINVEGMDGGAACAPGEAC